MLINYEKISHLCKQQLKRISNTFALLIFATSQLLQIISALTHLLYLKCRKRSFVVKFTVPLSHLKTVLTRNFCQITTSKTLLKNINNFLAGITLTNRSIYLIIFPILGLISLGVIGIYDGMNHKIAMNHLFAQTANTVNTTNSNTSHMLLSQPKHVTAIKTDVIEYSSFRIQKSIYLSGKKAGLSPKIINKYINIFNDEINFSRDVHDGDHVAVICKKIPALASNPKIKPQLNTEIMAAELTIRNKTYRAIRFTDNNGHTDYYTPKGVSLKASFTRAPVRYTHISSKFSLHRWHPILHVWRAHLGVDFAAPIGTPVKATAAGRIAFADYKNGYGKTILIQHDSKYSTLYAHLSGFAKKLHRGSYVQQNQLIGFLGSSGVSTGPHVHYELRIYGIQRNPLTVKLPHLALSKENRVKFFATAKSLIAQLNANYPQYASAAINDNNEAAAV